MLIRIKIILILLISFWQNIQAQMPETMPQLEKAKAVLYAENAWLQSNQNAFEMQHARASEIGYHFLFIQLHQSIPVYGASAKINVSKDNGVLSVFSDLQPILFTVNLKHVKTDSTFEKVWRNLNGTLLPGYTKLIKNTKGEWEEQLLDADLNLVQTVKRSLNARKDTLVQTKVFNPDPLTSAQKTYGEGGQWKNYNGTDSPELNGQRATKSLNLKFENDTFFGENKYAIIMDLESPTQQVFVSKANNFDFTRSKSQFREFNCLYHIENFRKYLASIGLLFSGMFQIEVDPTAYQGFDQSRFDYSGLKPALFFGTGGVADAEDADVIVHEYTHAINYFVAPNTTNGNQRLAVEEANCDVMACFYSKEISSYKWRDIFSWDGHNEFWDGRDGETTYKYPTNLSSDFYESSLIWSSMLNDIGVDIGRDALTRILFNSVYSYANNITMQQAADLFLQADSLIYGRSHFAQIKSRMAARGFSVSIGIKELTGDDSFFKLINSFGFSQGTDALELLSKSNNGLQLTVYAIDGREVLHKTSEDGNIKIQPDELPKGSFVIYVNNQDYSAVAKIVRY